jgi:hypothetical protein
MDLGGTGGVFWNRSWNLLRSGSGWILVALGVLEPEPEPFKNRIRVDLGHTQGSGIETGTFKEPDRNGSSPPRRF